MVVDLVGKTREILNATVLSALCKLGSILEHDVDFKPIEVEISEIEGGASEGIRVTLATFFKHWNGGVRTRETQSLASFCISQLPGNWDSVVFHDVWVGARYRNHGIGSLLHGYRLDIAKAAGASWGMCTVRESNISERKILFKFGWKQESKFPSVMGGKVELWTKEF